MVFFVSWSCTVIYNWIEGRFAKQWSHGEDLNASADLCVWEILRDVELSMQAWLRELKLTLLYFFPWRMAIQWVSFFRYDDFSPYKWKVSEFQPWSGHCPPTQHHVPGQHRLCWEVVGWQTGGQQQHHYQHISSACSAEPSLCPAALAAWDQGTFEKLPMLGWQRWASSAAAGDREREVKVSVVAVRNEARGNFSMPATSGQNTTVAKAGRKGLSQFSHKSFIASLMKACKNHPS